MDLIFKEREKFGRFWFRFPNGEAGTDVFDRTSDFISSMFNCMDRAGLHDGETKIPAEKIENYVLVTHGLLMRIFCMCYLKWTVVEFEQVWNPENCEIWVLDKIQSGQYELAGRCGESGMRDIRYGLNKSQPIYDFMKRPSEARKVLIGDTGLDADDLMHLQNLPGPIPNNVTNSRSRRRL